MQLVSPSLPVGGFTYSQGIEWAVQGGWIRDADDLGPWLLDQLRSAVTFVDLPLLARMHGAARGQDPDGMSYWLDRLIAYRETAEIRAEESNRGRALAELLAAWGLLGDVGRAPAGTVSARGMKWKRLLARSQAAGFAFAAAAWDIPAREAALGYAWSWLENLLLAGVKIIPLGQTEGQRLLERLAAEIPGAADLALSLPDEGIGASSPGLAIASSAHESQYARLFRS
jgi:urease accessory protein